MIDQRIKSDTQSYYAYWFGVNEIYERWAKAHGLTANALFVIYTINEYPDHCTPSALCKNLLLSKQTINSILNRLQRQGYVQRVESHQDKRSRFIIFTPEGKAYAQRILDDLCQYERKALGRMSEAQRSALLETGHIFLQELRGAFPETAADIRR